IHVHTLMGIHKEFFEAANILEIPIIYTTHDYFGLSPIPNFFYNEKSYDKMNTNQFWFEVSKTAMSTKRLKIFQLPYYYMLRFIKDIYRRKKIELKKCKEKKEKKEKKGKQITDVKEFELLRKYYQDILLYIDTVHFNSSIAKNVFLNNTDNVNKYKIIPITNSLEGDSIKKTVSPKIRVAYIGPDRKFKGFFA